MRDEIEEESMRDNVRMSRGEFSAVLLAWAAFATWVLVHAHFRGYSRSGAAEPVQLLWGMPAWVFWGILVPWLVATAFTVCFCVLALRKR